jgi:hypothetical protein
MKNVYYNEEYIEAKFSNGCKEYFMYISLKWSSGENMILFGNTGKIQNKEQLFDEIDEAVYNNSYRKCYLEDDLVISKLRGLKHFLKSKEDNYN